MENKKELIVTLADSNFIKQAKQLFSSVYWNAGWKGDYLLLAHNIPEEELKWFKDKGILTYNCKPLFSDTIGMGYNPVILDKLYLFSAFFKQWKTIVFIDSDIIVKGSLDRLLNVNEFSAADSTIKFGEQFFNDKILFNEIRINYNLKKRSFNTGLFAFPTCIINENTFEELLSTYKKYQRIAKCNEETVLNLYFYKNWKLLPHVYNYFVSVNMVEERKHMRIRAIVYHFLKIIGHDEYRPWHCDNIYNKEWNKNLENAEKIDLSKPNEIKSWSSLKIVYYSFMIKYIKITGYNLQKALKNISHCLNQKMGNLGLFIKGKNEKLYYKLKKSNGNTKA